MIEFYTRANGWGGSGISPSGTKVVQYPGGEIDVVLNGCYMEVAVVRGGEAEDIIALAMWADARRRLQLPTRAVIPYLPGARQDRGSPLGSKVYADIINSADLDFVLTLDPHSDVICALVDRLVIRTPADLHLAVTDKTRMASQGIDCVLAPDAGAARRAFAMAKYLGLPLLQATKHRDPATGYLSGFEVPSAIAKMRHPLIVDDICDGGGTFIGIADIVRDYGVRSLSLYVSHGIFSRGADRLSGSFTNVYSTDTHPGSKSKPTPHGSMDFVIKDQAVKQLVEQSFRI